MRFKRLRGQQIAAKAAEYIGTPWHHCGRRKGKAIDCIGLLACVLAELGVPVQDVRGYSLEADNLALMTGQLSRYASLVEGWDTGPQSWRTGDVLVFRQPPTILNHCGIYVAESQELIHAWATKSVRKVARHPLDSFWRGCVVGVYRYKGIR